MKPTVVKIDNLVKRYGELVALDHFSLEIKEGEIFGLLGPNGSGKTTTINCLLALLSYDKGDIEVFGKPMEPTSYDIKREIELIELAYKQMVDKGMDLTAEVMANLIEEMKVPVVKVRKTTVKTLKGEFDAYIQNAIHIGVVAELNDQIVSL